MANNYKEIVTKAVLGKGKKTFTDTYEVIPECVPTTILGCWVINHNFKGYKNNNQVTVDGTYDVNIWYSCNNDSETKVIKETKAYSETVSVKTNESSDLSSEEIIVRSLKQPTCLKADIENGKIIYKIEKELGIEIVGDAKVKIQYDSEEDPWDNLNDDEVTEKTMEEIDNEVKEDTIETNKE